MRRPAPFECAALALTLVDRLRLAAVFADRQDQTAIDQLEGDVPGSGREEDHHRTFHVIIFAQQAAAVLLGIAGQVVGPPILHTKM